GGSSASARRRASRSRSTSGRAPESGPRSSSRARCLPFHSSLHGSVLVFKPRSGKPGRENVMPDIDETNITQTVLDRLAGCPSPRLRVLSEALVRHLHAFVREVEPTTDEWMTAIEFLTRTGQICSSTRQEFILLSDTLGVSMLVDAINHRFPG